MEGKKEEGGREGQRERTGREGKGGVAPQDRLYENATSIVTAQSAKLIVSKNSNKCVGEVKWSSPTLVLVGVLGECF